MNYFPESEYKASMTVDDMFDLSRFSTKPPAQIETDDSDAIKILKDKLADQVDRLADIQQKFYADGRFSLLLIFQAMDAAGKDSTIRHVFSGVNPAGFQEFSFKQPSKEELAHDFLWRTTKSEPEKGHIGIFNRSYYEEVLVVRVHPEYLSAQRLTDTENLDELWQQRFESIRDHEKHLYRNNTLVLKFFLNVSHAEQRRRFLSRLEKKNKQWKFSANDLNESALWDKYMQAYQQAILHTSTSYAPWYVIPADNKPFMRWQVANIVCQTMEGLPLSYPQLDTDEQQIAQWKQLLRQQLGMYEDS